MHLSEKKIRQQKEFYLVNDFQSKLDAQKELRKIRSENALFGKRKIFVFSSQNSKIKLPHGVYEQAFYAN